MPEYSSTTINPSDGVQVPGMNGSTSGNFLLSALKSYILSEKGLANGLASLDANGKLPSSQLPDLADDVIVVASYASLPATGTAGKIYITADNNKMYRWDPELTTPDYVELSVDLSAYATIADLQDGTLEPLISTKSRQDQNGNVIDTTYATKAELAAEESARESEDSNLKSAIEGNSQRIENLEVAVSGSLVQTNTDSTMANTKAITNANSILPWAILKRVGARAVAWNQLQYNGNFASSDGWQNGTVSDGHIEGSANAGSYWQPFNSINKPTIIQGHIYYIRAKLKAISGLASGTTTYNLRINGSSSTSNAVSKLATSIPNGTSVILEGLHTANANTSGTGVTLFWGVHNDTNNFVAQWSECIIVDLTIMGMASYTVEQLSSMFCGSYPYTSNPSIIPLNPTGFKVVGKQKWDEQWEVGIYNITTGEKASMSTNMRSKTLTRITPDTEYYFLHPASATLVTLWYDIDGNYLEYISLRDGAMTATSPSGAFYVNFYLSDNYGATYNQDIMVCLNSVTDKTYEAYHEQTVLTPQIADGHYVNENCYDYVENVVENGIVNGKKHSVICEVVITESNLSDPTDNGNRAVFNVTIPNRIKYSSSADVPNILMAGFISVSQNTTWASGMISASITSLISIYVIMPTGTTKADMLAQHGGDKIYYELESESITDCDPIPNISCEDGTTVQAVTPQTELVNAIDVPSTIAYMTKIAS